MTVQCKHTAYNWDLVYRCRGCDEIIPEEIAVKHDNQLEEENEALRKAQDRLDEDGYASLAVQAVELEAENVTLKRERAGFVAEIAGMRDKWTPPDEVAELQAENVALKRESNVYRRLLRGEGYSDKQIDQRRDAYLPKGGEDETE